jgi:hypothetical protein
MVALSDETNPIYADTITPVLTFPSPGKIKLQKVRANLNTIDAIYSTTVRFLLNNTLLSDMTIAAGASQVISTTNLPKNIDEIDEIKLYIYAYSGTKSSGLKVTMFYNMIE